MPRDTRKLRLPPLLLGLTPLELAAERDGDVEAKVLAGLEMRTILTMLLLVLLEGPAAEQITTLSLGDPLPSDARETGIYILVAPAQLWPEYKWVDRGIEYSLAANQARLQYIATSSLEAQTPDGVRVGQTLEEVLRTQKLEVDLWRGWGYVVELRSGWKAALFLEGQFLDRRPLAIDHIDLLFKGTAGGYGS